MSLLHAEETNMEHDSQFNWGKKGVQFYESCTLKGTDYSLYDSVYLGGTCCLETAHIGKLVEMYDTDSEEKKIKVVWFFRPAEIRSYLGDYEPHWNEIFLASGVGKGLSNVNSLEAIVHKCNVVCTSKDTRNRQPSDEELRMANYIFCRTFDVGQWEILEQFPDEIDGIGVECFFNKRSNEKLFRLPKFQTDLRDPTGPSNVSFKSGLDKQMVSPVKNGKSGSRIIPIVRELEKPMACIGEQGCASNDTSRLTRIGERGCAPNETSTLKPILRGIGTQSARVSPGQDEKRKVRFIDQRPTSPLDTRPYKKIRVSDCVASTKGETSRKKPDDDRRFWFKQPLWEEKLQRAQDNSSLVLLDNLDPSYSSSEVEGLVLQACKERVEAKMIPYSTFSTPQCGKAFVLFTSKVKATRAISELNTKCLVQTNGRPVIGIRRTLKVPDKAARFVGHLSIDKIRLQSQREEMRKAVSTSHCSQPNTIEYDMAMEWCLLQKKSDAWWKALSEDKIGGSFVDYNNNSVREGVPQNWTANRSLPT